LVAPGLVLDPMRDVGNLWASGLGALSSALLTRQGALV